MNVLTSRRSILIGSLTSAAFPLAASAHALLSTRGPLTPSLDQASAQQTGILIPASLLTRTAIMVEAYDETGLGQTGTGYIYSSSTPEHRNRTAIVTKGHVLSNSLRNFEAKRVFLTFTHAKGDGLPDRGQKTRMEVSFSPAKKAERLDAHSELVVVAMADWHRAGNEWHLKVG
jgi:hypothetical protein